MSDAREQAAADAVDERALVDDLCELVRVPSVTGDERAAMERLAELAARAGLEAEVREYDLARLRARPDHPGEEAERTSLTGVAVALPGAYEGPRLCLSGHLDVVGPGEARWSFDPWAGDVVDGQVRGRGSVDMKGGVAAAVHAMAAMVRCPATPAGEIILHAVASEEDGGLGTFAALERDAGWDAVLIPEPTGFDVVCAQAGALTFSGEVSGVAAHAALRLEGISAIDRYVIVHRALHEHERAVNARVAHPLMRELELPYPLSVGRLEAGTWSSSVPDHVRFEGRLGVRVDETLAEAGEALELAVARACPDATLRFDGARFAPATTAEDHPFVALVQDAFAGETDVRPRPVGVPWGADMRLFAARGIPCVMIGTGGIELAHAVDERVRVDEVVTLARGLARLLARWGA